MGTRDGSSRAHGRATNGLRPDGVRLLLFALTAVALAVPTIALGSAPHSGGPTAAASYSREPSVPLAPDTHVAPSSSPIPSAVAETIDLVNNSMHAGNYRPQNLLSMQAAPATIPGSALAIGTATGGGSGGNGEIFEFNTSSVSVVGSVSAGFPGPLGVAYDPLNQTAIVASSGFSPFSFNQTGSGLTIVTVAPLAVARTMATCNGATSVAFDAGASSFAVSCVSDNTIWVYNATDLTHKVLRVGSDPVAVVFDGAANDYVVANNLSDN